MASSLDQAVRKMARFNMPAGFVAYNGIASPALPNDSVVENTLTDAGPSRCRYERFF